MPNLKYYLQALGLCLIWDSYAITTILRDGLHILPGGSAATILVWVVGILLLTPINIFNRISYPNKILAFTWLCFVVLALIYLNYRPRDGYYYVISDLRETLTFVFPPLFLFATLYLTNEHCEKAIPVFFFYTLLVNILFVYVLTTNPSFNVGERAGIKFDGSDNFNPHPFANIAFKLLVSGLLFSTYTKSFLFKTLIIICAFIGIVVMLMTRTGTSLYALGIATVVFMITNAFKIKIIIPKRISVKPILILGVCYLYFNSLIAQYPQWVQAFQLYQEQIGYRFSNILFTVTGVKGKNSTAKIDDSSMGRVLGYRRFDEFIKESSLEDFIFGKGYGAAYIDVPVLDSFINYGLIGFVIFNVFALFFMFFIFIEMFRPSSKFSAMIAYSSLPIMIGLFAAGRSVDVTAWMAWIPVIRFLGVPYFLPTKTTI